MQFKNNTRHSAQLAHADNHIPVQIICEQRGDVRMGISSKAAILRMPNYLPTTEQAKHWQKFADWVFVHFQKDEKLRSRFFGKKYRNGDKLELYGRTYTLRIQASAERKNHHGKIEGREIQLDLVAADHNPQKAIRTLISRCVAADIHPDFERRVHEINDSFVNKPIKGVVLKQQASKWGSCSSGNNLNFSTNLLFAPPAVIDYVIIHELAHLVEFNHSPAFWSLVEKRCPHYLQAEKWLKVNGHTCAF